MGTSIRIPQLWVELTDGASAVAVCGSTVAECLDELTRRYPPLKEKLFAGSGNLHTYIEVYINGASAFPGELKKPVAEGDELQLLNIIAGG
ncbi:MAG: MoaD/ThiS family protein [Chloroflexota bacterium]